jgi:hypothetical protein
MFDAFIIERIRQRQERPREDGRIPLHIEQPLEPMPMQRTEEEPRQDRGIIEIDFSI